MCFHSLVTYQHRCYIVSVTGHVGPSNILSESLVGKHKGLNRISRGKSASVQFFGTHDLSRCVIFNEFTRVYFFHCHQAGNPMVINNIRLV